uniref:Putative secreted protein n=1 Tax=Anopheles marajoara TaxID=58244 RepID=A0A2M4CBR6_9DIPT
MLVFATLATVLFRLVVPFRWGPRFWDAAMSSMAAVLDGWPTTTTTTTTNRRMKMTTLAPKLEADGVAFKWPLVETIFRS